MIEKNKKRLIAISSLLLVAVFAFTFQKAEQPTKQRRQGSIPKQAPWKTSALNEQTRKGSRI